METTTYEIYTLSLHDALPISAAERSERARTTLHSLFTWLVAISANTRKPAWNGGFLGVAYEIHFRSPARALPPITRELARDRKSTRLNSSHPSITYAVFC